MGYINHNTSLRTNKHLSYEEHFYIEKQLQANVSKSAIAKALGRSRTTIYTEIRRGTVVQIKQGKPILMYLADRGQSSYEASRKGSFNTLKAGAIDLPLMVRRSTRKVKTRKHKKHLGKSIDLRDESILHRKEFGHWELDTVRGVKDKQDEVIVSLLERKTRVYVTLRSPSAKATDIAITLQNCLKRCNEALDGKVLCKTITSDNGLEFSSITNLENDTLQIFFAHPYAAWERGSNERHNGLLCRFIPKGTPIHTVSEATLKRATNWCNTLPRKILGYRMPQEAFLDEIKKLTEVTNVQFHIAI